MKTEQQLPFRNADLPLEDRVADLVSRFTLEEKIESMVQYQPAIERLGVRAYKHGTEAAHGMAWLGEATSFPQPIGLGCTWNEELMEKIGSAIGDEARVFYDRNPELNGLTLWAPTVDMERDPRWGRTEEAYGEDPVLTGELTAGLVKGMQGDHPKYFKSVATLKHFIGNNNEINRGSCSASIDPRNMKEYYQAAFKPAFVKGGAHSMMTSYNSVNGTPTILLDDVRKVVKEEWGMNGFIVSDAGDLLGLVNDHHYCETYKEAVALAVKAGIDSITDDKEKTCAAIREALNEGLLSESDLDRALVNTFRVRFLLGEFDPAENNPYASVPASKLCAPEHGELSLRAAKESIVLLKNEGGALPLQPEKLGSVAVIGPLADVVYRDWYSGTLPYKVTPLDGIKRKLERSGAKVLHAAGDDHIRLAAADGRPLVIDGTDGGKLKTGSPEQQPETFRLTDWGWGSVTLTSASSGKLLTTADDKHPAAAADEAFGWFVKEIFKLNEDGSGGAVMRTWNGKAVLLPEGEGALGISEEETAAAADAFRIEKAHDGLAEAVQAAKAADRAIVVVGNNPLNNGKEEIDRPGLELAESQQALIRAVLEANPDTVVVVIGSYPFALGELADRVPAILYMAHAGQELGHALADALFGDYSPAGRLNMTWYRSASQLTDIMDYDIRKTKRTYMYMEEEPLYPFGHGLSYAEFRYGELRLDNRLALGENGSGGLDGAVVAKVRVENVSGVDADEVVQLYVSVEGSRVQRPRRKLAAFKRVTVPAGTSVEVELEASSDTLAVWDVTREKFCLEKAAYTFMAGASSADIRAQAVMEIEGETIPPRNVSLPTRAESYDDYEGVYLDESKEGGACVRTGKEEGWILFRDVDWSCGAAQWSGRACGGASGGTVTLRSGGPDGPVLGACRVEAGGEQEWTDIETVLRPAESDALCLVLNGTVKISHFSIK